MSGGGGNTTTVQSSEPWAGQIPWLHHVYNTAGSLPYQQVYPGQLTAPVNREMQEGWASQAALGRNNPLTGVGTAHALNTLQNSYMGGGTGELQNMFSGQGQLGGGYSALGHLASGQGQYQTGYNNLADLASERYGPGSQQFSRALESSWNKIRPGVQSQFARSGRLDSGLARAAEASEFGNLFGQMYNQDLQRRLAASQGMGGYEQNVLNRQLASAQGMGQLEDALQGRRLGAAGALSDAFQAERMNQMRTLGLAPGVQGMGYTDAQQLLASGYGQNQYQQDAINREMSRWNQQQLSPYNRLAAMSTAIQGGFPGGTQTINEPYYGPSTGQSLGSLAGMGIGGFFGGPFGAVLGGSAGGILGGLF